MKSAMLTASYIVDTDKANKVIQLEFIELQCGSVLGRGETKQMLGYQVSLSPYLHISFQK